MTNKKEHENGMGAGDPGSQWQLLDLNWDIDLLNWQPLDLDWEVDLLNWQPLPGAKNTHKKRTKKRKK